MHALYFLIFLWGEECLEQAQRSSSTRTQRNKTLRDEVSDRGRQGKERRGEAIVIEDGVKPPQRKKEHQPGGDEGDGRAEGKKCTSVIQGVWCGSVTAQRAEAG